MPSEPPTIECSVVEGASALQAAEWDTLVEAVDPDFPFLEHAFLAALERSRSVGPRAGWIPKFVIARNDKEHGGALIGAVPLYLKDNSYGEFIFDWSWANAAYRSGLAYYPKLVAAIPFTPATGRRLLVPAGPRATAITAALLDAIAALAEEEGASSVHILFCTEEEKATLAAAGYAPRLTMQFHWTNRAPDPFRDFDDYLGAFRSRNRKQVRKERQVAAGHGLRLATLSGPALSDADWAALEGFYRTNVDKHDGTAYLTGAFFADLRSTFAHRVVATLAYRGEEAIAGTLNFERGKHLYGRYWGAREELEMLHFELCYYQLIDRAIARGCTRFEAGAQGEHKLKRGLLPALTHSAHLVFHPEFAQAVGSFVAREAAAMTSQVRAYDELSPFARGTE